MSRPVWAQAEAAVEFDDAIALLAGDPERLLEEATTTSARHTREVVATLHLRVGPMDLGRTIEIEVGEFEPVEVQCSVLPLRWRARRGHAWFPTMDARLEITALSSRPPRVRIAIAGGYTPPLGALGDAVDAVAARRIADTTIEAFVDELAGRLERLVADPVAGPSAGTASMPSDCVS